MASPFGPRFSLSRLFVALSVCLLAVLPSGARAEWIDLGGEPLTVTVLSSEDDRTVLEVQVGGFSADPVAIDGDTYYTITLGQESEPHQKGFPALPDVQRSIVIPDDRRMNVRVLEAEPVDFPKVVPAPSKGHFTRDIDPATVPYTFDTFYASAGVWPETLAEGEAPYILRDLRGMVVDANVFQYLAGEQTLRVYRRMVIEIAAVGADDVNVLDRKHPLAKMDRQFARLYADHFVNFEQQAKYVPVLEDGGLLIIAYDAFRPYVEPLLEWKLQKGIPTQLVNLSTIGATSTAIQNYIRDQYYAWDPAYVLLVGDAAQVPTISYGGGSDPSYSLIVGSDNYPDLFIGRFSAETVAQVETQVERTIAYERDTPASQTWPQYGMGVASNQGVGDDNEYDNEHMDNIRADLLPYGYIAVDQIYDPTATAAMVSNALNAGRGIANYCGHGSTQAWTTTGFSNTHIAALTNDLRLPFICSVACLNGNFVTNTCFAEAWLRAEHNGVPTGAIATYMSTISQSWDPPMSMQDEGIDLMCADEMRTIGGLWFNGSCLMMDEYGSSGVNEFKCWTIFGDPSLAVRTKTAQPLTVNHSGVLLIGMTAYDVEALAEPGALCALYADGILYGSALAGLDGRATIVLDPAPAEPMALTLTVTAYNRVTHNGLVEVIPPSGPYLLVGDTVLRDGNGDGVVNAGETVEVDLQLRNVGITTATGVSAQLSVASEFVILAPDTRAFADIPAGGEAWSMGSYVLTISPDCPDQLLLAIAVLVTAEESGTRLTWEDQLAFTVHAPLISAEAGVDDSQGGNGNGRLDPGESASIVVTLSNDGHYPLTGITASLVSHHPDVTITADAATLAALAFPATGNLEPAFALTLDGDFAQPTLGLYLYLDAANGFHRILDLQLSVGGQLEAFEQGPAGWTHLVAGGSFVDQWHLSVERNHTTGGGQSWKCGDSGTGSYAHLLNAALVSPAMELNGDSELRFWMWIESETSPAYPGRAYDGGIVEMSLNGGAFTQVTPVGGYTHTIRAGSNPGPFPADTPVFAGQMDWQEKVVELDGVTGSAVFRFRVGSDGAVAMEGWHIDDVELWTGASPMDTHEEVPLGPAALALSQSTPNPFHASARIAFGLPRAGQVRLQLFDASGRLVRTLLDGEVPAGFQSVVWDGRTSAGQPAASGIYFYRLSTPEGTLQHSLVLSR